MWWARGRQWRWERWGWEDDNETQSERGKKENDEDDNEQWQMMAVMTPMMTIKKQQWWRERWPRGRWWEPWQRLWSHFVSYDGYISLSKSDRNLNPLTDLRDFHHSGRWQKKKKNPQKSADVTWSTMTEKTLWVSRYRKIHRSFPRTTHQVYHGFGPIEWKPSQSAFNFLLNQQKAIDSVQPVDCSPGSCQ